MSANTELLEKLSVAVSEKDLLCSERRREGRHWLRKSRQFSLSLMYNLKEMGVSQRELAERMGVSPSYIGKLLRGKENLSLETITKVEEALGVEMLCIEKPYTTSLPSTRWFTSDISCA